MMLTQSPAHPSPATASPGSGFHSFHYAPAPSPRQSPSRVPAALSRRQSASSLSAPRPSPSLTRPKRYVGVDAATQYSPMESVDYATGAAIPPVPSTSEVDRIEPPPTPPGPRPMALSDKKPTKAAKAISHAPNAESSGSPVSSVKRRNSQGPGGSSSIESTTAAPSDSTLAKRSRPEEAPPKFLPQRYEYCAVEDVVVLIAHMLGELIETNDDLALKSGHLTRFHSRTAPGISVLDYLHRLAKHATLTPPLLLSMVYYIDRLCALYPEFTINTLTVHRFLITAATVAAKGLSDAFWNNSTYARVGGVKVAELKLLELEFLYRVDWKIVPNPEVLVAYYHGLVERCPGFAMEAEDGTAIEDDVESSDAIDDDDVDEDESMPGQQEGSRSERTVTLATSEAQSQSVSDE
ncbi:cyclin-domain-containing protein [Apodospora peruviana]|uniref:Cyclin-domain-containing protein n=1 Tax=Apodospora peruviana TaxID=516989 RepID=A0AAE0HYH7_9PEZI|nr:cyclin-domain-containing protein [Apodospora peruviana]